MTAHHNKPDKHLDMFHKSGKESSASAKSGAHDTKKHHEPDNDDYPQR
jgi:hypothetical protein